MSQKCISTSWSYEINLARYSKCGAGSFCHDRILEDTNNFNEDSSSIDEGEC